MNIVLIGFRATGKSTVGELLAGRIGWSFIDTDSIIEAQEGRTIAQVFGSGGESRFRAIEAKVVARAAASDRTVIAAGGGSVLNEAGAGALAEGGFVVLLRASREEIESRLGVDIGTLTRRPALTCYDPREEIERLLAERNEIYERLCDACVDTTGKSIAAVVEEVARLVEAVVESGKSGSGGE